MSLYKRGGTWWMSFTIDNKQYRLSTKQSDKYKAGLVMNDEMAKARKDGVDALLHRSPVLQDFAPEFIKWVDNTHSIDPKTKAYYKNGWRLLSTTALASMKLNTIKNHSCETIPFPGSNSNANVALRTLRRMLGMAKEVGKFYGELPKIENRKEWGRSIKMSMADADLIASKMPAGDCRDAFQILRGTGMRPTECFTMRWEYINWPDAVYANPKGKTRTAKRDIPLLADVLDILKGRHTEQGKPAQGWIFPTRSKTGHLTTIKTAFNRARDLAGLPKQMVLYTARHGRMSDLSKVCALNEVMQIGGHSDPKTALRYQHTSTAELQVRLEQARTTGRVQ